MSEQATQTQPMSYEQAIGIMNEAVFVPVFLEKLAEYNIHPQSTEEVAQYLELNEEIKIHEQQQAIKTASARNSLVGGALGELRRARGVVESPMPVAVDHETIKQAADRCRSNAVVRDAALLYQDAMRQIWAQQQAKTA